jgi:hypothetical protein
MNYYIPNTDTMHLDNILFSSVNTIDIFYEANNISSKFLKTISSLGFIDTLEEKRLLIYSYLMDRYYFMYEDIDSVSDESKKDMLYILDCLKNKSCLLNKTN